MGEFLLGGVLEGLVLGVEGNGQHASGEVSSFETKCQKGLNLLLEIAEDVRHVKELLRSEPGFLQQRQEFAVRLGDLEPE